MSASDSPEPASFTPPSPAAMIASVATKCGVTRDVVDTALRDAGIALRSPLPANRKIQVLRLRLIGAKHTGEQIAFEQRFGPGLWAITHDRNSAGKTSLLESIVWPLRGEPRDLPPDVRSWLTLISIDAIVGGRFVRISIEQNLTAPQKTTGRVMQAANRDDLLSSTDDELVEILTAANAAEVEDTIGIFMLDALGLEHTAIWNARGGSDGEGAAQRHGWASYFGACYLNPGGDKLLFGDVAQSQSLSARLLELFVAIPYASTLTHINATTKRQAKADRQARERAAQDVTVRSGEREKWLADLATTRSAITSAKQTAESAIRPDLEAVDDALASMRVARQLAVLADDAYLEARSLRIVAAQRALDVEETWEARRVLGLLNPVCCPRCEVPFDSGRQADEKDHASCSVCTRPLPAADEDLAEGIIGELRAEADEARLTETQARQDSEQRAIDAQAAMAKYEGAQGRLNAASVSSDYRRLRELELVAARLEGQLAATGSSPQPTAAPAESADQIIAEFRAAVEAVVKAATNETFPQLDKHIVELAQTFGVENLDSVRLQRNGHINAIKAGEKTPFDEFSRGDRLRMRIAAVVAMLRVGSRLGTHPHPGLLLIDAVGSEEVTLEAGHALVTELERLATELPDLQIILTTATPELVRGVLNDDRIVTAGSDHMF